MKRSVRRKTNRSKTDFNYDTFEPRNLLAAVTIEGTSGDDSLRGASMTARLGQIKMNTVCLDRSIRILLSSMFKKSWVGSVRIRSTYTH